MKKREKNKRVITKIKTWFLVINLVIAIIAFGWMVGGVIEQKLDPITETYRLHNTETNEWFDSPADPPPKQVNPTGAGGGGTGGQISPPSECTGLLCGVNNLFSGI